MPTITWTKDPETLAQTWKSLQYENQHRLMLNKDYQRLYFDLPNTSYIDPQLSYSEVKAYRELEQSAYNITRMVIDSVAPTICERLRVVVEPVGSDYQTERSCSNMASAITGILEATKYWDVYGPIAYRDGSAGDIGTVLWYVDGAGEIRCRDIGPNDVRFHFDEGRDPLHLYYGMLLPRAGLYSQFPGHEKDIDGLPENRQETVVGVEYPGSRSGDCVQIVMAYRRAYNGEPGKCTVVGIGGGNPVLYDQPWKYDFFPSAHWRYDWDAKGFGGYAGARVLAPYHIQSDKLLQSAYEGLEGAVPTVVANEMDRDGIEFSHKPWRAVYFKTSRPEVMIPKAVSSDVLAEIGKLKDTAFFAYGQSMQAAQGLRPAGLNSAPAQREWVDIKNQRMARLIDNYAMMATDSARIIVALASEAYRNKKILAKAPGTEMFQEITWPKDLREDKYKIRFMKASDVPDTVAGRVEFFGELRDRGAINEAEYLRGIAIADLKGTTDRLAADADYVDMQISSALDECVMIMPDAMQGVEGLDMLVAKGRQDYLRVQAAHKNYPNANLRCLRRLVQAADMRRKGLKATIPMPVPAALPGQPAGVQPMPSAVLPAAQPTPAASVAPATPPTPVPAA